MLIQEIQQTLEQQGPVPLFLPGEVSKKLRLLRQYHPETEEDDH